MEDTERASSAALGSAPHEESGNEASAAGKTRADEPLLDAEETRDEQVTEVTSTQQITEVNTAPQTAEVTSAEQITEVTSAEQTSLTPTTEVNTAQQTAEVTLTNVSAEQITEADPQITEQTDISLTQTTVVTSPEQVTEVTSTSPEHVTEVKADPHITEVTQITEDTSLTLPTEATSPEQVTEVRVDPQITEVTSSTQVTEETSLTQITEVTSPEQVSELKPDPQISEETLTQTAGVTSVSPEPITEITSAEQTSEETSLTQISEDVTEETSVPPVSGPPPPPPHHPAAAAPPPDRSLAPCNARPPEPCGEPHSELPPAGEPEVSVSVFQTLPSVLQLLYWRDVRASALVLGSLLLLLLFLSCCSVISVLSYSALCLLTLTLSTRVFTAVLQAMRKTEDGHPFRQYLERDVLLSADAVHTHSEALLRRINTALVELRRLFLVEDLVDSLKLAVGLWLLTYVGSWFNGLTLLIIALIGAFSGPIAYERHQSEIDQFISMINTQMREALGKVLAMVPGGKKKSD
nr:reticulon 6-a2 [Danio rerio]